jgi:hypothetical protein
MTMTTERAGELALSVLSSEFSNDLKQLVQRWFIVLKRKGIESGEAIDLLELMLPALLRSEVQQFVDLKKKVESDNASPSDVDPNAPQEFPLKRMIYGIADECAALLGIDSSIVKAIALKWLKEFAPQGVAKTKPQSVDEVCTDVLSQFISDIERRFGINADAFLGRLADLISKRVKATDSASASDAAPSSGGSSGSDQSSGSEPVDASKQNLDASPASSTASESNTGSAPSS